MTVLDWSVQLFLTYKIKSKLGFFLLFSQRWPKITFLAECRYFYAFNFKVKISFNFKNEMLQTFIDNEGQIRLAELKCLCTRAYAGVIILPCSKTSAQ